MTRLVAPLALLLVAVLLLPAAAGAQDEGRMITTATGLRYVDLVKGTGPAPRQGQTAVVHYTGWLYDGGRKGKQFDSSVGGEPFAFALGTGSVIRGWDQGVRTMRVGGRRRLIIPPRLGYGARGKGGVIPPNATLIFEIELLAVE